MNAKLKSAARQLLKEIKSTLVRKIASDPAKVELVFSRALNLNFPSLTESEKQEILESVKEQS